MAKTEHYFTKFEEGKFYHIYNRSIDKQLLFKSDENYIYFLKRFDFYLSSIVEVYAFCLLDNHFHILLKIPDNLNSFEVANGRSLSAHETVSKKLKLFFQSYAMSFNNQHRRVGTLFQTPFKRVLVEDNQYLTQLIWYIHSNPQKHKLTENFTKWKWTSYHAFVSDSTTKLVRGKVLELFGGKSQFIDFHKSNTDLLNEKYIIE